MSELYHYGILGMKWGVRRFQNPDGTLTEAGKKRYSKQISDASEYGYLNTGPNGKKKGKTEYRDGVRYHYIQDWKEAVKNGMPENEASEIERELWEKYKDRFAVATLNDLDIPVTQETRALVEDILSKNDPMYNYDDYSGFRELDKTLDARVKSMLDSGHSVKEIMDTLDISKDTVMEHIKGPSNKTENVPEKSESEAKTDDNDGENKAVSDLNDQELQKVINRKRMEQDYERLTKPQVNNQQNQQNQQNNPNQERRIDSSEIRGKTIAEMTDRELQIFMDRINMERKVEGMFKENEKSSMDTVKKVVNGALATGVTVTTALATYGKLKAYLEWLNSGEYDRFAGGQKKK